MRKAAFAAAGFLMPKTELVVGGKGRGLLDAGGAWRWATPSPCSTWE